MKFHVSNDISSHSLNLTNCNSQPTESHVSPEQNAYRITYPKLKGFKFAHVNITSLPKHLEELRLFLQEIPFEILSLNETRLDETIQNNIGRFQYMR